MASRNYTNGLESAQARTEERSALGDGLGEKSQGKTTPVEIRTALGIPPSPADTASAEMAQANASTGETVSATTQSAPPAPTATPIAKSKTETAEKAQLDSGQIPMSQVAPAGTAGSPDAAPLTTGAASRGATSTKATAQSAENLKVHAGKTATPAPSK